MKTYRDLVTEARTVVPELTVEEVRARLAVDPSPVVVDVRDPDEYREGAIDGAVNISRGGIAIRTTSPLANGASVRLRFRLPGSKREIEAEGRVSWSDRRHGMGLQFERVESQDQSDIDEFANAHFFSSRKA